MAASPVPSASQVWMDPAMQKCAAIVRKAYPSDAIAPPVNPNSPQAASSGSDTTYAAVEAACQDLAIFAKIADAAGKNLTVTTFTRAGATSSEMSPFPAVVDLSRSDRISPTP